MLHFFLAMLIVLGTLTAAASVQFAADGWVNLALPLAVLPLLVHSMLDAVSAAFLAPLLGVAFCVATVLSRAGLSAAAPLAGAAIWACILVAFLVHHPSSPAASVYVGPVLLPPSATGVQILVVVPAAVLYEWLVVTRLLAIHMVYVAFSLGYRPIWLFEVRLRFDPRLYPQPLTFPAPFPVTTANAFPLRLQATRMASFYLCRDPSARRRVRSPVAVAPDDEGPCGRCVCVQLRALACVSRRMPTDSAAWRGVTWAQEAATAMAPEAARLVEAFEEMYRLPGSAVRFRLVDTAHVDLFAVPSRVMIAVESKPHALNSATREEDDELNRF